MRHGVIIILFIITVTLWSFFGRLMDLDARQPMQWGVTFSPVHAEYLDLDPKEVYLAMLDDLQVHDVRIPVYWNRIESNPFDEQFAELDWYIDEASRRDVRVTLALGQKVPRWPECHLPDWTQMLDGQAYNEALLRHIGSVAGRYVGQATVARFQIENEPLYPFGDCDLANMHQISTEREYIHLIATRQPIVQTTSGEQSFWPVHGWGGDMLGVSLYREVWNPLFGRLTFPLPPIYYRIQSYMAEFLVDEVYISELQMEPWMWEGFANESLEVQLASFDADNFTDNIDFARRTGIREAHLWGIEWWYYMNNTHAESELWDAAHELFHE